MKLWIFSDLHLEMGPLEDFKLPEADVCVVAGDIDARGILPSLKWLGTTIAPKMPVVFVAGNHEFYRAFMSESLVGARDKVREYPALHFLEDDYVCVDNVVFIGCTLWTDFDLFGIPVIAMRHALDKMNDYRMIGWVKQPFSKLRPNHTRQTHARSLDFIERTSTSHNGLKRVVVTHHAPSIKSIPAEYRKDLASASYASHLEGFVKKVRPKLWIHGHVHQRLDYKIGQTRILCNPLGYRDENLTDFDPGLVIDV